MVIESCEWGNARVTIILILSKKVKIVVKILDFLSKIYSKRAKSDDPAYSLGWSSALAFRNDRELASYRNYVLSEFELPEEELDARYAAETLHSEMNPNWDVSVDFIIGTAQKVGIAEEFISLAKVNSSAAKLLSVHLKMLGEVGKFGRVIAYQDIIHNLDKNVENSEGLSKNLLQDQLVEIFQLSRIERHQYYADHEVENRTRFLIELTLLSISDDDDLVEPTVEEYHLLWANDEEEACQSEPLEKLKLLKMLVDLLDRVKSSRDHVNIMCLASLLVVENEPKAVDFIISNILKRSRYIAVENDDELFVEKYLLEGLFTGQFWNNGAVFGSILKVADRRLITQAYKYMERLDHNEVHNAVYCCEITTSAPVVDFLIDWATHFKSVGQGDTMTLVVDALRGISQRLTGHDLTDGSFKDADLWSDDNNQITTGFSVPFIEYMEKHKAKVNAILGSEVESSNHQIEICVSHPDDVLEIYRDKELAQVWRLFIEGYWGEDEYHMGFIEYSVARCVDGMWLMNACSRYECLDNVTQTEVDENQLTADQAQAIFDHGSLEEAQQFRYNRLVAASFALKSQMHWRLAGDKLYNAVIVAGGKTVLI